MDKNKNNMKRCKAFLLLCLCACCLYAQDRKPYYKAQDSVRVESLLREASHLPQGTNRVLFFARRFMGVHYVAHTIEVCDPERLVINLDELDCTTYVDVVTALVLASRSGKTRFADFCDFLQRQRYRGGVVNDYTSRNHYFSSWIMFGQENGLVREITGRDCRGYSPFKAVQRIKANYMTKNPGQYKALAAHPEFLKGIRTQEDEISGMEVQYIPNSELGLPRKKLSCIQNGDILAMVTSKEGLEISHLGFAVWHRDGSLHLLNASSLHKKVISDPLSLQKYMQRQPRNLGIRVIRILGDN